MKTKLIAAALAATVLAGGGVALAQNTQNAATQDAPKPPRGGLFVHADANKDGVVTREELLASIDARFAKGDTNKDGKIDATERQTAGKAAREARLEGADGHGRRGMRGPGGPGMGGPGKRADANNDGVLTRDEARAPALKLFAYVDRNNDGRIDKAEAAAFREAAMAAGPRGGPGKHGRHGGHHGRHGPPPAGAPAAPSQ